MSVWTSWLLNAMPPVQYLWCLTPRMTLSLKLSSLFLVLHLYCHLRLRSPLITPIFALNVRCPLFSILIPLPFLLSKESMASWKQYQSGHTDCPKSSSATLPWWVAPPQSSRTQRGQLSLSPLSLSATVIFSILVHRALHFLLFLSTPLPLSPP